MSDYRLDEIEAPDHHPKAVQRLAGDRRKQRVWRRAAWPQAPRSAVRLSRGRSPRCDAHSVATGKWLIMCQTLDQSLNGGGILLDPQ
jgi:hypothetical protein